jgi:hypothetical protein
MRWQDRFFWPVIWTIYLGPIVYIFAEFAVKMYISSTYDCEMSARGVSPCVINGKDWGEFLYSGVFFGYAVALFVLPWLIIGGGILGLLAWLDRNN